MTRLPRPMMAVLCVVATLAIAGLVHGMTILAAPARAHGDAFTRIAARTPANAFAAFEEENTGLAMHIPFRDPAMVTSVCRFDLRAAPLRLTINPFARGFAAVSLHGRRGEPFYGLTVDAGEHTAIVVALMTPEQQSGAESQDDADEPNRDLRIVAPDPQGFILVEAPAGEAGAKAWAQDTLRHVGCASQAPQLRGSSGG